MSYDLITECELQNKIDKEDEAEFTLIKEGIELIADYENEAIVALCEDASHLLAGSMEKIRAGEQVDPGQNVLIAAMRVLSDPVTMDAISSRMKNGANTIREILKKAGKDAAANKLLTQLVGKYGQSELAKVKASVEKAAGDETYRNKLLGNLGKTLDKIGRIQTGATPEQNAPKDDVDVSKWFK